MQRTKHDNHVMNSIISIGASHCCQGVKESPANSSKEFNHQQANPNKQILDEPTQELNDQTK